MISLCSINDNQYHKGTAYCTAMKPMANMPRIECLCPTKDLVYGYKYDSKSVEWYTNGYRALLASKWADVKQWLDSLKVDEDMALVCYCKEGVFCHRQLMMQMIEKWRPDISIVLH